MTTQEKQQKYTVLHKLVEAPGVVTLQLACKDGSVPQYRSGQFINVYFPEAGIPEGKAYSISSAPGEKTLNITVKAIGRFSHRLCAMSPGDTFLASLPYGYFFSESTESDLVMLAAGIGITPFRSMIMDILESSPVRNLFLFQSAKIEQDIIFKEELSRLESLYSNLHVLYFITQEECLGENIVCERISAEYILKRIFHAHNPEFFICGSISFVSDLWKDLRRLAVPETSMYTEAFFSY